MRVNLLATSSGPLPSSMTSIPLTLLIRPSCGLPGDYSYFTDSTTLLRMLREKTELRASVLERFQRDLRLGASVPLRAVELSNRTLTEIGYFID